MCASCVTLHTEEHREKGTHGHYLSYEAARNEIHNNYEMESFSLKSFQKIMHKITSKSSK